MKIIKTIVEDIRGEMEGAEHYIKLATQYKNIDRMFADVYTKMCEAELSHVDALHNQAIRLISAQKAEGVEIPASMQAVWDWEHEKMIDTTTRIKMMLNTYRSS